MAYTLVMNPFLTAASENGLSSPSCAPARGWSSSPLLRPAAPPLPSPSSVSPSAGAGCWPPILHQCCRLPGLALCCCFAVLQYCSGAWPCPAAGAAHCTGTAADAVHGLSCARHSYSFRLESFVVPPRQSCSGGSSPTPHHSSRQLSTR